jgi:hypothetical protein
MPNDSAPASPRSQCEDKLPTPREALATLIASIRRSWGRPVTAPESPADPSQISDHQVLVALLADVGNELRSRRDPEHLYTAASVGAFGAVAWGVSTLAAAHIQGSRWGQPPFVAAAGVVALALVVSRKIYRVHQDYVGLRAYQGQLARALCESLHVGHDAFPRSMLSGKAGSGHWGSILVVAVAALAAVWFCLSLS